MSKQLHLPFLFSSRSARQAILSLLLACSSFSVAQTRSNFFPRPARLTLARSTSLPAKIAVTVPGRDTADQFAAADLEEAINANYNPTERTAAPSLRRALPCRPAAH